MIIESQRELIVDVAAIDCSGGLRRNNGALTLGSVGKKNKACGALHEPKC